MEQTVVKFTRQLKWLQLILLILVAIGFLFILIANPSLLRNIFTNRYLFLLCSIIWGILLFSFLFLLYDFSKLGVFVQEGHNLNKTAYLDTLTGIPNRFSCDALLQAYQSPKNMEKLGCVLLEISNLSKVNEVMSHEKGDAMIQSFCTLLETVGSEYGFVGRNGGNEFLTIMEECSEQKVSIFLAKLQSELQICNAADISIPDIELHYSYALNSDLHTERFTDLITAAYKNLSIP